MKVLVVKTSSMGDIIHTLPALTEAAGKNPDIRFDWVVEEGFSEIPSWHPNVNEVIPVALRRWRKTPLKSIRDGEVGQFLRRLRQEQYDFIIDAQGLIKSGLITRFSKGKRIGYSRDYAKEGASSIFYQSRQPIPWHLHATTRIRQLFSKALNYDSQTSSPDFGLSPEYFTKKAHQDRSVVFIHGTSREDKCWPEDDWAAVGNSINEAGLSVKLLWGNEKEHERAIRIALRCKSAEVCPKMNLFEVAKVLSESLAVITVDTGLGHLAGALGLPTYSLYSTTDIKKIGTQGNYTDHGMMADKSFYDIWEALRDLMMIKYRKDF